MSKTWNFSAGPGVLPKPVLEEAQRDLLNFAGTNCSLMELSHRSKEFEECLNTAKANLARLLNVPANYKILFMQGGATNQFSTVVYNLVGKDLKNPVDYVITGAWSKKAAEEATKLGANVKIVVDSKATNFNGDLPDPASWSFTPNASYVYFCDNETVHGVEFDPFPFERVPANVPVVCDMSSSILSKPVDVSKYAVIFAGAQKNMGPAGVTVAIVRDDLIGTRFCEGLRCPVMMDFKICADNNSLYNTPPTWAIYVTGLVLQWLLRDVGGLESMSSTNARKSSLIYSTISSSEGFYWCPVQPGMRSRMNVPFRIMKDGKPSKELEAEFLRRAEGKGMVQLAGHRSVGGIRASLYNALPVEAAEALAEFMREFEKEHR
ncbi:Phosphoserine aminotransferase [Irineochytrium annulatum]|nr:Phosphoserine aminotransferase [Irineochytrium annulatum]